jgi:hypothetical protein
MLTIWYRLAQLPLSHTLLRTALRHRHLPPHHSRALALVFSDKWLAPLREYSPSTLVA